MQTDRNMKVRRAIERKYSAFATEGHSGGCCGIGSAAVRESARQVALSCGSPLNYAHLEPGATVIDLGCGGGIDAFAAAQRVGQTGRVIGIDSTAKMIARAKRAAQEIGCFNVEFRQGDMERISVPDRSADLVISNCAVNLAPNKGKVYAEIFRVLKRGGSVVISDIVAETRLPNNVRSDLDKWSRCLGGALTLKGLKRILTSVGLVDFKIMDQEEWAKGRAENLPLLSITFSVVKP
jgi:arsenite methyltransferase